MKKNINYLQLREQLNGNLERADLFNEPLKGDGYLPDIVLYKDIDIAFKEWAEKIKLTGEDGKEFPTMTLFSNQRFSEYSQSWEYVDANNNLILNFKTVSRDNKPEHGTIHGNVWNIPGEQYFTMARKRVLDDNGTESFLNIEMKMPTSVDIIYKFSVFTVKYEMLNKFNEELNKLFNSIQCYICPNGHYMPMKLESFDDNTEYNIDDRQYYGQTANIRVEGYILDESDFRIQEMPMKVGVNTVFSYKNKKKRAKVEIEDVDETENVNGRYYQTMLLKLIFDKGVTKANFTIDTDFSITEINKSNVFKVIECKVNGNIVNLAVGTEFKNGDEISFKIKPWNICEESIIVLKGFDFGESYEGDDNAHNDKYEEKKFKTE